MLPRLIDSALLREWTVHSLIVDRIHLVLASGKASTTKKHYSSAKKLAAHKTLAISQQSLDLLLRVEVKRDQNWKHFKAAASSVLASFVGKECFYQPAYYMRVNVLLNKGLSV